MPTTYAHDIYVQTLSPRDKIVIRLAAANLITTMTDELSRAFSRANLFVTPRIPVYAIGELARLLVTIMEMQKPAPGQEHSGTAMAGR